VPISLLLDLDDGPLPRTLLLLFLALVALLVLALLGRPSSTPMRSVHVRRTRFGEPLDLDAVVVARTGSLALFLLARLGVERLALLLLVDELGRAARKEESGTLTEIPREREQDRGRAR